MIHLLLGLLLVGGGAATGLQDAPPAGGGASAGHSAPLELEPDDGPLAGRVRVLHWPGDEEQARRVLNVLEVYPDLPALPEGLPSDARVILAPDMAAFDTLTGGEVPDWGAGVAIPSRRTIVIPVRGTPWSGRWAEARLIRHEWAHLGLHEYLAGLRIPRWFDEGYAQWASGGWSIQEAWRLRFALAGGGTPPLEELTLTWPRDRASAELAYMLSATALEYLTRHAGERGLAVFLERWRETQDFEQALRRTYGFTSAGFEDRWRDHVASRYGWILVLSQTVVYWGMLGVILLILFRIRRKRDRERMAELRAQEPPEWPAWWRGDPFPGEEEPRGMSPGPPGRRPPPGRP